MNLVAAQNVFYRKRVPEQFNHTLESQREAARSDASAASVLGEMEAVRTAILVQVHDGATLHRHALDIERGRMHYVDAPSYAPFLVLGHALEDFEDLRRECGDSLLGFLGGLAGLGDQMRLTAQRVRSLRELDGNLVFERTGPCGFVLSAAFGVETIAAPPRATIRIDEHVYAQLRSGKLDPQNAFLEGQIEVEGDMEMAIGLALAALSPG